MRVRAFTGPLMLVAVLAGAQVAFSAIIDVNEDPALFGTLKQSDTVCPSDACGPTSATNAFTFLDKLYPSIYQSSSLVPPDDSYAAQVETADTLATDTYMGTCSACGTFIEDYIVGINKWIETQQPGVTGYDAQMNFGWRNPSPDGLAVARPGFVQDSTTPTLGFIASELSRNWGVEIFLAGQGANAGNHYVTVYGITYDTTDNTGTLRIIDPADGGAHSYNITGLSGGFIDVAYNLGGAGDSVIAHAVAEGPTPEPATYVLMISSLGIVCFLRRRLKQ